MVSLASRAIPCFLYPFTLSAPKPVMVKSLVAFNALFPPEEVASLRVFTVPEDKNISATQFKVMAAPLGLVMVAWFIISLVG